MLAFLFWGYFSADSITINFKLACNIFLFSTYGTFIKIQIDLFLKWDILVL